ncbi:hypothetical protein [Pseudomonas soli]|uniref:hypothetical protein n=1 Tax=Pseudomonas soli TaxID=1306993 RepID=UPI0011B4B1B0|nr:hypothetical protein [Pseudomonas soli]
MIIKKTALTEEFGKWAFRGLPYSGAALEFRGGELTWGGLYVNGCCTGVYRSEFISEEGGGGIESERDYTGEQFFWGDEIYNGFAYEFVGDICVSERLFEYGWVIAEVTYYSGGQLRSLETGGDIIQKYEWYESGDLIDVTLYERDYFMMSLGFSKGRLQRLTLMGDYFGRVSKIIKSIKFPVLREMKELSALVCGSRLSLSGDGVDESAIKYLLSGKNLIYVNELYVDRISDSPETLARLRTLDHLKELKVSEDEGRRDFWRKWCAEFKALHTECDVYFNNRIVGLGA